MAEGLACGDPPAPREPLGVGASQEICCRGSADHATGSGGVPAFVEVPWRHRQANSQVHLATECEGRQQLSPTDAACRAEAESGRDGRSSGMHGRGEMAVVEASM